MERVSFSLIRFVDTMNEEHLQEPDPILQDDVCRASVSA